MHSNNRTWARSASARVIPPEEKSMSPSSGSVVYFSAGRGSRQASARRSDCAASRSARWGRKCRSFRDLSTQPQTQAGLPNSSSQVNLPTKHRFPQRLQSAIRGSEVVYENAAESLNKVRRNYGSSDHWIFFTRRASYSVFDLGDLARCPVLPYEQVFRTHRS